MTLQRKLCRQRHHRGLSLLELLVSLAVGLVLVLAAGAAYLSAARANRMAQAQMRMDEDGQAALAILAQQLRMAGNNPDQPHRTAATRRNPVYAPTALATTFTPTDFAIRGCDSTFRNIKTATSLDNLICAAGAGGAGSSAPTPHSIAITYEADPFNTLPTAKGVPTDCLGNALDTQTASLTTTTETGTATTSVDYHVADNRYYIGTTTAVLSPSLYCKGRAGAPQPLVENIEDMQFSYGTMPASATSSLGPIAGYLSAGAIGTDPGLALLADDAARWEKVVAVRICVLVRSEYPVVDEPASARWRGCDGTLQTHAPDLRLRRAYSTTVALRNRLGTTSFLPSP